MESETTEQNDTCPHLGLADDAASLYSFPSPANRCYAIAPQSEITSGHQSRYCLGASFANCPVFQGELVRAGKPIGSEDAAQSRLKRPLIAVPTVGIVLIIGGALWATFGPRFTGSQPAPSAQPAVSPPSPPPPAPTETIEEEIDSPAPVNPTPTAETPITPTQIPQPTPGPVTETPVGPFSVLVRVLNAGETLGDLAVIYDTSIEVILIANNLTINDIVQQGQLVVVPVGITDPTGIPHFKIYSVAQEQTIDDIAALFDASPNDIRQVNELGTSEVVPAGRTLLVPVAPTATLIPRTS